MDKFRLLSKTRQSTEYSCGASALQAVLSYWGMDVEESDLMTLLHTNPEVGTYPEDIARGAHALGFDAKVRENLTLDEVDAFTANGHPMIALAQVWRSQKTSTGPASEEWDNGHYIVVLGVDESYVYFQDPYVRMSKAFVPRKTFEEHWHQVMGGDLKTNPKLMHLGIFIQGKASPATRKVATAPSVSGLNFHSFGSLNLMITQFPDVLLPYDFLTELNDIWENGSIRPDAFIFFMKDKNGNLSGMEGSRLREDDDMAAINAILAAITGRSVGPDLHRTKAEAALSAAASGDFGLSASDIRKIAQKIPSNSTAIIAIFENVWERRFKEVARKYNGAVVAQRLISPAALERAAQELAAAEN